MAKDIVEMEHGIPDNIFHVSGSGQLLTGEDFFKARYARYKKAYQTAKNFKRQIDDCAATVAADQALAEVEENLSKQEIE